MSKKPDPGLCTSNEGRFLKFYIMNILDNLKNFIFYFHSFGVRRTIMSYIQKTSPDPVNLDRIRYLWLYGIQGPSVTISMKIKKKALKLSKIFIR